MEEIYREEARRYKESIEKERLYDKSMTVTMPTQEFDKLEKLALSAHTDKLSVEKLQEIRVAELKDFSRKILQGELKNQKLQEHLNTAKKALEEIVFFSQGCYAPEYFASIAQKALAALEGGEDE